VNSLNLELLEAALRKIATARKIVISPYRVAVSLTASNGSNPIFVKRAAGINRDLPDT
jgi:hypothetical protein